jgi:DNA-binding NtrC family response regulator
MNDRVSEVFIAEDVPSVREMLRITLEDAGYHVFEAGEAHAMQRMLRNSPCPMVVLLDSDLPGLGAEDILSRVMDDAALARHAYVYVTGTPLDMLSPALRDVLSRLNVAVLTMPFTTDTLLEVVGRTALRRPGTRVSS